MKKWFIWGAEVTLHFTLHDINITKPTWMRVVVGAWPVSNQVDCVGLMKAAEPMTMYLNSVIRGCFYGRLGKQMFVKIIWVLECWELWLQIICKQFTSNFIICYWMFCCWMFCSHFVMWWWWTESLWVIWPLMLWESNDRIYSSWTQWHVVTVCYANCSFF